MTTDSVFADSTVTSCPRSSIGPVKVTVAPSSNADPNTFEVTEVLGAIVDGLIEVTWSRISTGCGGGGGGGGGGFFLHPAPARRAGIISASA